MEENNDKVHQFWEVVQIEMKDRNGNVDLYI